MTACSVPSCKTPMREFIDGIPYCDEHGIEVLTTFVRDHAKKLQLDDKGRPRDKCWLNRFARLVVRFASASTALSKAKVETRACRFTVHPEKVVFAIDRHPVGRVTTQCWEYIFDPGTLNLLSEHIQSSEFRQTGDGSLACPNCGGVLSLSPGTASCECGFKAMHEHTLGS